MKKHPVQYPPEFPNEVNDVVSQLSSLGFGSDKISKVLCGTIDENGNKQIIDITDKVVNQIAETPKNQLCECNYQDLPVPAVTFGEYNIYSINSKFNHPSTIYNALFNLNNYIMTNTSEATYPGVESFTSRTVGNVMDSNIKMATDSFLLSISNIYKVFVSNVNEVFVFESNNDKLPTLNLEECPRILHYDDFIDGIYNFLQLKSDDRMNIVNGQLLTDYALSYVNNIGVEIYNFTRFNISSLIVDLNPITNKANDIICDKLNAVDSLFCEMMKDFTIEVGNFSANMSNIAPFIIDANTDD